jgi:hypothetical protein
VVLRHLGVGSKPILMRRGIESFIAARALPRPTLDDMTNMTYTQEHPDVKGDDYCRSESPFL